MAVVDPIRIDGLAELKRAFGNIDKDTPKTIRLGLNEVAEIVAKIARSRAPKRSGKLAASIKANSTATAGRVKGGSKTVGYFGFIDYGGKVGVHKSVHRPFIKTGRIMYPAFDSQRDNLQALLQKKLDALVEANGLSVTGE